MHKPKKSEKTNETPESGPPLTPLVFDPDDAVEGSPANEGTPRVPEKVNTGRAEPDSPEGDVVDARSLDPVAAPERPRHFVMRRRWFTEQPTLVRFISTSFVLAPLHQFVKVGATKPTLHCNGTVCALCLAKHKPTLCYLHAIYVVDEGEVSVIDLPKASGATSLLAQLLPILKQPNFSDLIVEISKDGKGHSVAVVMRLDETSGDGGDYGDDVLRDLVARGGVSPDAIRAVFERWDNQTLLAGVDRLATRIRMYHPGIDLSKL